MSKEGSWGLSDKPPEYVVSTDLCRIERLNFDETTLRWLTVEGQQDTPFNNLFGSEYLYWINDQKQMNGAVEKATVFATKDEAEAGAFLAASLDPELAGHVYAIEKGEAFRRDKEKVERRAEDERVRKEWEKKRFTLGGKDGGGL